MEDNEEKTKIGFENGLVYNSITNYEPTESKGLENNIDKNNEIVNNTELDKANQYGPNESRRILKNVYILSASFALLFTAYSSMSTLQSSINSVDGLGVYSQSVVYGCLIFSALFLATFVIKHTTVKWAIPISMIGYILYIAGQFYPSFATLIPAAVVVGLLGSSLWSAKCTYLSHIAREYGKINGIDPELVLTRFFGIFFFLFQTNRIFGNIISSTILSSGEDEEKVGEEIYSQCGFNFCPWNNISDNPNLEGPSDKKIYTLATIYLCTAISAVAVVSFFLDPLSRYGESKRTGMSASNNNMVLFKSTMFQMKKFDQILLIPITLWSGLEQGLLGSDYTQAYISCAWGIGKIGYVFICFGISDSLGCKFMSTFVQFFGRVNVFLFGALLNGGLLFILMFWNPNPNQTYIYFIIGGLWGIADSIWQTQVNALYGLLFPNEEEASFANYRIWESLGFVIIFILTDRACIDAKIYLLFGSLALGILGYLVLEFKMKKEKIQAKL